MEFKIRGSCAVCERSLGNPVIDLPNLPQTGIFVEEKTARGEGETDQEFHICKHCGHGQLKKIISPDYLYGSSYSFKTSESPTAPKAIDFFIQFIEEIMQKEGIESFDNLIEIGCNDCYLLKVLKNKSRRLIGIDPILKGKEIEYEREGIVAVGELLENVDLRKYIGGKTAIISSDTLEHIENPRVLMKKILEHADENTFFFFHFPGIEGLIKDLRFDQIFHQHIQYFSLYSFDYLLKQFGGELIYSKNNPDYWATWLMYFKKSQGWQKENKGEKICEEEVLEAYRYFKKKISDLKKRLDNVKTEIYGYGAGAIVPMLAYYMGIDFSKWKGFLDDDPKKNNKFYLGFDSPINMPLWNSDFKNSTIVITATDNTRSILPKTISYKPKHIILLTDYI